MKRPLLILLLTSIAVSVRSQPTGSAGTALEKTAQEWVLKKYNGILEYSAYGLVLTDDAWARRNHILSDPSTVHIFFDEFGNSLLTTVPQGISNMQYVVHVVYVTRMDTIPYNVVYSINQKKGKFSSNLVFTNQGALEKGKARPETETEGAQPSELKWVEESFLLGTSTDDIEFDIVKSRRNEGTTGVIATHTINMSPVYSASFNIGLLRSNLKNPTHSIAPSPSDPAQSTVLEKDAHNRGQATVMATLYMSPVVAARYLFQLIKGDVTIPSFQLYGRNFLYDHKFYERIYPAFGVSLNNSTFENLFFGLNLEFARGGSFFIGMHYGKVNTFDKKGGFVFGETTVTQAAYDARIDHQWKTDWAFGVNLDVSIVKNLLKE